MPFANKRSEALSRCGSGLQLRQIFTQRKGNNKNSTLYYIFFFAVFRLGKTKKENIG
jgi:hypothetical protein